VGHNLGDANHNLWLQICIILSRSHAQAVLYRAVSGHTSQQSWQWSKNGAQHLHIGLVQTTLYRLPKHIESSFSFEAPLSEDKTPEVVICTQCHHSSLGACLFECHVQVSSSSQQRLFLGRILSSSGSASGLPLAAGTRQNPDRPSSSDPQSISHRGGSRQVCGPKLVLLDACLPPPQPANQKQASSSTQLNLLHPSVLPSCEDSFGDGSTIRENSSRERA